MSDLAPRILDRYKSWISSPESFVQNCLSADPTPQQLEGLRAFGKSKILSIRSGHGCGKTAFVAWCVLYFLSSTLYPKIVCTATTAYQLSIVLWAELSKWLQRSKVKDEFEWQAKKIFLKECYERWYAVAVTADASDSSNKKAESMAGVHEDNVLFVIDEASGVRDAVFETLRACATKRNNFILMTGNMTRSKGFFYDTHFKDIYSSSTLKLHWDSEDSSLVDKAWLDEMALAYGKDSNVYKIRVKGEPPSEEDDTLIPYSWVSECIGNTDVPEDLNLACYAGIDVAGEGKDNTVELRGRGGYIYPYKMFNGLESNLLVDKLTRSLKDEDVHGIAVDQIGVGWAVCGELQRRLGRDIVQPVNVSRSSTEPERFHRLRDQLWWALRDKCERRLFHFPPGPLGERLADELSTPTFSVSNGKIKVEDKPSIRKKLRALNSESAVKSNSPDVAEALLMREWFFLMNKKTFADDFEGDRQKTAIDDHDYLSLDDKPYALAEQWL